MASPEHQAMSMSLPYLPHNSPFITGTYLLITDRFYQYTVCYQRPFIALADIHQSTNSCRLKSISQINIVAERLQRIRPLHIQSINNVILRILFLQGRLCPKSHGQTRHNAQQLRAVRALLPQLWEPSSACRRSQAVGPDQRPEHIDVGWQLWLL